jgi:hypothetical protein
MTIDLKIAIDRLVGFILIFILNIVARVTGIAMRRDHSLQVRGDILIIKMLGGGSLVMAMPALLGLRRTFPQSKLRLFTTAAVAPFAASLNVFDEIVTLDDSSVVKLVRSGFAALRKCFGCDVAIDLEVYSYLTTVFSLFTFARNRLGFFFDEGGFQQRLHTHRVFFNPATPLYAHYDRMADLLGAKIALMADCAAHLRSSLDLKKVSATKRIAVGCGCSELSYHVRRLSVDQWVQNVFGAQADKDSEVIFLGSRDDHAEAERIIAALRAGGDELWRGHLVNKCGALTLAGSLWELASCNEYWGVDSALLHYARLFGLRVQGFFGPADPATRLRPIAGLEEAIHYRRTLCSPCVHQISVPPCHGNNLCMQWLFDAPDSPRAGWIPTVVDTKFTETDRL